MCFTVNVNIVKEEMEKRFGAELIDPDTYRPSYYYHAFDFPRMPVITSENPDLIKLYNWGLIPFWTNSLQQSAKIRTKTFNARAETITQKPSFRVPILSRRCLVPAMGFYEWQHRKDRKIPYYIYLPEQPVFSMAGIFDIWVDKSSGELTHSFSIITVSANPMMAKIHNSKRRMPALLSREEEDNWLNPELPIEGVLSLLKPFPEQNMKAYTISPLISKRGIEKNHSRLIEPYAYDQPELFGD